MSVAELEDDTPGSFHPNRAFREEHAQTGTDKFCFVLAGEGELHVDDVPHHLRPGHLIATRTGIEAAMWHKYATRATAMRCDTPFPARQRVDPRTSLRQRCYFKPTLGDKAFGKDSGNAARTVAVKITIYDGWIRLDETTQ